MKTILIFCSALVLIAGMGVYLEVFSQEPILNIFPVLPKEGQDYQSAFPLQLAGEMTNHANKANSEVRFARIDKVFLMLCSILGFTASAIFYMLLGKAKRISYWAVKNQKKTKLFLIAAQVLTSFFGFLLGKKMYDHGMCTTGISTNILFAMATSGLVLYPFYRQVIFTKASFIRQKMPLLLLLCSGFFMSADLGNRSAQDKGYSPIAAKVIELIDKDHYSKDFGNEWAGGYPGGRYQRGEVVGNIFLTLLALIVLAAFLAVIAYVCCILVCAELHVLAIAVAAIGGGGAIYLFIRAVRAIWAPKYSRYGNRR